MTDYIIVGGGSAGCVLANRLSANPAVDVTLIEAGGWDRSPFIGMPAGYFQLMKTGQIDWGYHTEPQEHLAGRRLFWPRAKVLGGCSCVNGMIYIRGSATDYDHWAALGNSGWSFRDCLPYFLRAENWNGPRSPIHGHDGPLHTSRYGVHHPCRRRSSRLAYRPDTRTGMTSMAASRRDSGPATARSRPSKTRESARARLLLTCIR